MASNQALASAAAAAGAVPNYGLCMNAGAVPQSPMMSGFGMQSGALPQMMIPGMPMPMPMMSAGRGRGQARHPMMPGMMPAMMMPGMLPMTMGMVPPAHAPGPSGMNALAAPWMMQQQAGATSVHDLLHKPGSSNRSSSAMPAKAKGHGHGLGMISDKFPVKAHCLEHIKDFCFHEAVECMMRNWSSVWNPATLSGLQPLDIIYCWLVGWDLTPAEPVPSGTTKGQWQLTMSYLYQANGHKLQSMTMEQVREQGRTRLAQYEADMAQKRAAMAAQYEAMQAQNMAMFQAAGTQAFPWPAGCPGNAAQGPGPVQTGHAAAPVSVSVPANVPLAKPADANVITAPDGRKFLQVQDRSRFLSRQASGGADDWTLSPGRSNLVSPSKALTASVMDVVTDDGGDGGSWRPALAPEPAAPSTPKPQPMQETMEQTMEETIERFVAMQDRMRLLEAEEIKLTARINAKRRRLDPADEVEGAGSGANSQSPETARADLPAAAEAAEEHEPEAEVQNSPSYFEAAMAALEAPMAVSEEAALATGPATEKPAAGPAAEKPAADEAVEQTSGGQAHGKGRTKPPAAKASAAKAPAIKAPAKAAPKASVPRGIQTTLTKDKSKP